MQQSPKLTRAEVNRRYRERHPERIKEYQARPEVRERHNINGKIWLMGTIPYHEERRRRRSPEIWCHRIVIGLRARAKKIGIPFDLTGEDVFAVLPADMRCPALGTPFVFGEKLSTTSPSVDRVIPGLGYVRGNIAVISAKANTMKSNCTSAEEIRRVADYFERALQRIEAEREFSRRMFAFIGQLASIARSNRAHECIDAKATISIPVALLKEAVRLYRERIGDTTAEAA